MGCGAPAGDRAHLHHGGPVVGQQAGAPGRRADGGQVEHGDARQRARGASGSDGAGGAAAVVGGSSVTGVERGQKFFGRPSLRRAMMFFWISEEPPPMVSITV